MWPASSLTSILTGSVLSVTPGAAGGLHIDAGWRRPRTKHAPDDNDCLLPLLALLLLVGGVSLGAANDGGPGVRESEEEGQGEPKEQQQPLHPSAFTSKAPGEVASEPVCH
eukprot:jgi/Mesen1/745/ME000110S_11013